MDRTNLDDPSRYYGLGHNAVLEAEIQATFVARRKAERDQYVIEFDIKGKAARLIGFYQALGMRKSDAEEAGVERFLSLAAGVYDRMWRFIERGMELEAAVLAAESEITKESDIEEQALDEEAQERSAKDPYLGSSVEDLMDVHKKTKGGGSKSKSYKSTRVADAPVVEQAIRKMMAA